MTTFFAKPPKGTKLQRGHRLANGLVGAWLFNEGVGINIHDSADGSNTHDLTLTNFSTTNDGWVGGPFGKCLDFDGTNDHALGTASMYDFERTQAFSAAAWVQWDVVTGNPAIIGKSKHTSPFNGWILDLNSSKLRFTLVNNGSTNAINRAGGTTVVTGTWYHVGFSYDGSSSATGAQIYLNGKAETMTTTTNNLTATTITTGIFTVGARNGANNPTNGRLDAVLLWNKQLSDQDFRQLYADSFRMFRRRNLPVPLHPAAAAPATGLLLKRRRMMV